MKKTKRLLSLLVALVMIFALVATLVACEDLPNPDDETEEPIDLPDVNPNADPSRVYDITVWVSEIAGVDTLTLTQIDRFNKLNEQGYTFNAQVIGVKEGDAASQMISSVEDGADIFCFAQDQTSRLVDAKALAQPGEAASKEISENNDASAVGAVTIGGVKRAYPLTSDNGYFMYYDKRVITKDVDLTSLEALVKACEDAEMNFSMELESSAWYMASFFFATGCHSNWTTDSAGKFTSTDDDFNSANGMIAMKGMQILSKSKAHHSSSDVTDFNAATPSAIVVSGAWAYGDVVKILGEENLGAAPLPSFTVNGKSYHMGSYAGNKLMGVRPCSDAVKLAGLHLLARYLTNKKCQLERFEQFGWGPSNLQAQQNEKVKAAPHILALAQQNEYGIPQGQIHGSWWDIAKILGAKAKVATSDAELQAALDDYKLAIDALFNKTDEELRRWSVIGVNGDWSTDIEMTEEPANTWTSGVLTLNADSSFKCRMGASWDLSVGGVGDNADNDGNYKVAEAGKYIIQIVVDVDDNGNATGGTITLIPQE